MKLDTKFVKLGSLSGSEKQPVCLLHILGV